jgi:hypothetical protein
MSWRVRLTTTPSFKALASVLLTRANTPLSCARARSFDSLCSAMAAAMAGSGSGSASMALPATPSSSRASSSRPRAMSNPSWSSSPRIRGARRSRPRLVSARRRSATVRSTPFSTTRLCSSTTGASSAVMARARTWRSKVDRNRPPAMNRASKTWSQMRRRGCLRVSKTSTRSASGATCAPSPARSRSASASSSRTRPSIRVARRTNCRERRPSQRCRPRSCSRRTLASSSLAAAERALVYSVCASCLTCSKS